jgi:hypothetical protein
MELLLFIQKFFIFMIPGAIGVLLFYYLNPHKDKHYYIEFLVMLMYSFFSFVLTSVLLKLIDRFFNANFGSLDIVNFIISNNMHQLTAWHVLLAIVFSICIALLGTRLFDGNNIFRIANKIRVTGRTSNKAVWETFMRTSSYIVLRDNLENKVYYGQVIEYSDDSQIRELQLHDVAVFNEESELLYKAEDVFISRNHNEFTIETYDYKNYSTEETEE